MQITHRYVVAELPLTVSFEDGQPNDCRLLASFEPFRVTEEDYSRRNDEFFTLHVDDSLKPVPKPQRDHIRKVDTGNGDTIVDQTADGGYQFIIKDIFGKSCCLLQTDSTFTRNRCALNGTDSMRRFGLNNALMLIFAFAGCRRDVVLIHASLVRNNGWGYAFTAKSGTGKSTHVSLWLSHIPGCDLMNDDNPIIRIIDGKPYIYGGPWSGKTPCYRNVKAKLGAVTAINRSADNSVRKATTVEAFSSLLSSCSTMKWDKNIVDAICSIITKIIETTPNYNLYCRPDREAAIVCHRTISRSEK